MKSIDTLISKLKTVQRQKHVILSVAVSNNSNKIAEINKDQLRDSEMVDKSPITWGRDSFKHKTYQINKKNQSKGRTGQKYTLFDSGSLYSDIKTEVSGEGVKIVAKSDIGNTVAKYYNGPTNYLGIQKERYPELKEIIIKDLKKEIVKRLK